jgi:hypothetical protein
MPPIFAAIASGNLEVDQIQMEVHALDSEIVNEKPLKVFFEAADAAKMRIFHKERNQWGCEGYVYLEYAFVSESFLREANSKVTVWLAGHELKMRLDNASFSGSRLARSTRELLCKVCAILLMV